MTQYNKTMLSDKIRQSKAAGKEYDRMISNKAWIPMKLEDILSGEKVLTST